MAESDQALLAAMGRGSRKAFEQIYLRYKDDLLTVSVWLLGDRSLAEDVLQDVFVSLAGRAGRIRLRRTLKGYLLASCVNKARDIMGRNVRAQQARQTAGADPVTPPGPMQTAICNEQATHLRAAVSDLPVEQRQVVALRIHGQLKFREIARLLAIPANTAQSRYRYALATLKSKLVEQGVER